MHIQCTKKMLDFLKPNITNKDTDDDIYAWHANYIVRSGKKLFLFVNDLTKFSIVLYPVKKGDLKDISTWFETFLTEAFFEAGFTDEEVHKYFRHAPNAFTFYKTKNRFQVARLNKSMEMADAYCGKQGILDQVLHQVYASGFVNDCYVTENNGKIYYTPIKKMKAYLELL